MNCGVVPAAVNLEGQDLRCVNPGADGDSGGTEQGIAAKQLRVHTWTFWPPESETYIEKIEKVWAGEMTAEQYLQGIREVFDKEREAGAVPPIPER